MALVLIDSFRENRIEKLGEKLSADINEIESKLAAVVDEKEFVEIKKAFTNIQTEIIFSDSEIAIRCQGVDKTISLKQAEFEEAKKIFSLILDTNIFLKDQNITSKIPSKYKIIVADKVVEELNSFKNIPQLKEISSHCISEIHLNRNKNIHRTKANLKRLPKEFSKKSPDNLILAVAFMYKNLNGILVSDVMELNDKAKQLDIPIMTHDNFIAKFITF
jgi:rRNA-processing protein FCF1